MMFNKLFNIVQKLYLSTSSFLKNTLSAKEEQSLNVFQHTHQSKIVSE